jgi:hypothetical protein
MATLQNNSKWQCEKAMTALSQDSTSRSMETKDIVQSLFKRKGEERKAVYSRQVNHVRVHVTYLAMQQKM